jgi:hypothetical protein
MRIAISHVRISLLQKHLPFLLCFTRNASGAPVIDHAGPPETLVAAVFHRQTSAGGMVVQSDPSLGVVQIPLDQLTESKPIDEWFVLRGADKGRLHVRVQLRFCILRIMRPGDAGNKLFNDGKSLERLAKKRVSEVMELLD